MPVRAIFDGESRKSAKETFDIDALLAFAVRSPPEWGYFELAKR
jgi:hypothetical protein